MTLPKPTTHARAIRLGVRFMLIALPFNTVLALRGWAQTIIKPASMAESAALNFDKQSEEDKRLGQGCLPILNQALNAEAAMNEMVAAKKSNTPEFGSKSQERSDLVEKFNQCITDAHRNATPTLNPANRKITGKPTWVAQTATDRTYRFEDGTVARFPLIDQDYRLDVRTPPRLARQGNLLVAIARYRSQDGSTRDIPGTLVR